MGFHHTVYIGFEPADWKQFENFKVWEDLKNPHYQEPHWSCKHVSPSTSSPYCPQCGEEVQYHTYPHTIRVHTGYTIPVTCDDDVGVADLTCPHPYYDLEIFGHKVLQAMDDTESPYMIVYQEVDEFESAHLDMRSLQEFVDKFAAHGIVGTLKISMGGG
jgi:hypothetical protein